ncbi:short chain dehydrogenase [Hirsutella rhossiliensis]|uniref:3-dehydrosphinganine reductase n=1 Tax=Hirsutella rhossiliensis TaxID=111463 RepID=A0A9P8N1G0_9HYPO|nr:short chain dehydrogenase domain-containing protein [Hirsutella rhossiliensis]KAH0965908.1 short chain dehydrogenase domain-containing protein [Hirsutella rhossiliensis]
MRIYGGNKMPVEGKTVLLTGASEGMGLSAAQKLAARGANIILVSRSVDKLKEALASVQAAAKNPSTQRFHYISADVSAPSYAQPLIEEATRWNNGKSPDIVWCVAGMSVPELFVDMDMESMRRQMDVNFYGTADMSHAILREWLAADAPVEKEPKHLIMTTSVVALFTIPGYAPYAPSKWALRGLADTISQEVMMYPQNVKVHVVYPGTILSPGFERENRSKPAITKLLEASDPKETPDHVADSAIRGLENGDYFVTVNFLGHLMRWGVLGGSFRNNWVVDTLGAWLASILWFFVQMDLHGKIRSYGKKHGHPSTYEKH